MCDFTSCVVYVCFMVHNMIYFGECSMCTLKCAMLGLVVLGQYFIKVKLISSVVQYFYKESANFFLEVWIVNILVFWVILSLSQVFNSAVVTLKQLLIMCKYINEMVIQ